MQTRSHLDDCTVATLRKLVGTKRGRNVLLIQRAGYYRAMDKMGCDMLTAYHGWSDCYDMAVLENEAA